jgi:hypothetical protein
MNTVRKTDSQDTALGKIMFSDLMDFKYFFAIFLQRSMVIYDLGSEG